MKRSNKILAAAAISLIIGVIAVFAIFRASAPKMISETVNNSEVSTTSNQTTITTTENGASKTYKVEKFNSISVGGWANVNIEQDNNNFVVIKGSKAIVSDIDVQVNNNQLQIKPKKNIKIKQDKPLEITVTSPTINNLDFGGKISFNAKNINSPSLRLNIGGNVRGNLSGKIPELNALIGGQSNLKICNISSKNIALNIAGNSEIELCGKTENFSIATAGKANIDADHLMADDVSLTGAGENMLTTHVEDSLRVMTLGKTEVKYYGSPEKIEKTEFGKIDLEHVEE